MSTRPSEAWSSTSWWPTCPTRPTITSALRWPSSRKTPEGMSLPDRSSHLLTQSSHMFTQSARRPNTNTYRGTCVCLLGVSLHASAEHLRGKGKQVIMYLVPRWLLSRNTLQRCKWLPGDNVPNGLSVWAGLGIAHKKDLSHVLVVHQKDRQSAARGLSMTSFHLRVSWKCRWHENGLTCPSAALIGLQQVPGCDVKMKQAMLDISERAKLGGRHCRCSIHC